MASKITIPAVIKFKTTLENSIKAVKTAAPAANVSVQSDLLTKTSDLLAQAQAALDKLSTAVEDAAAKKPKVERLITRFAKIYTPIVVIMAVLLAIIPSFITGDWQRWIYTALTFLVISCPCALVLSVPLSYFAGIGVASKQGILFKSGNLMETLKDIKMVVLDKTGTVTKGNFVVQEIYGKDIQNILKVCASVEQISAHPLAKSIVAKAQIQGIKLLTPTNFTEYAGEGIQAMFDDKEGVCGNEKVLQRFNVEIKEDKVAAYTIVYIAINRIYQGYITIADKLKEDAISAIGLLHKQNLKVAMLTGDSLETANDITKKTGIDFVKAKLLPQEKLQELAKLRDIYGKVMYVGDGINDAPVLAGADVSAAMGSGTDAAIEAADLVIMNSDMLSVPKARSIAQATLTIVWQNIIMALGIKIIIMFLGVAGYASMWAAVFADTGVLALCVLNAVRLLYKKF